MNSEQLDILFHPTSIAVIGASDTPGSVGYSLFRNLVSTGFAGRVYPVNIKRDTVQGVKAYRSVSDIPEGVDMALIAVPAPLVSAVADECGQKGIRALIVISAGFTEAGADGKKLTEELAETVRRYDMTMLGPNCLGFIRPSISLNASFTRKMARPGKIAFISQSGALMSAILDWSVKENVGFSNFVSIGEMTDIGFHTLIDHFGKDRETASILIYMESLSNAAEFMAAARRVAPDKPIIVLKVGRSREGARAALSHTGSMTGNDAVFDAAFSRAGVVRVATISELFHCAKTLAMQERPHGRRMTIVTNAGGPGVIATDMLIERGGALAVLTDESVASLDALLPPNWSHGNPVDVLGDADPARFAQATRICLNDPESDGTLVVLTPQAMTDAKAVAEGLVEAARGSVKTVMAAWMGEDDVAVGRHILEAGSIPVFEKPESAIRAFMNMYRYDRNISFLAETPDTAHTDMSFDTDFVRTLLDQAKHENRTTLTEPEAKQLLAHIGFTVPAGMPAATPEEAERAGQTLHYPLAMKIVSPDILHKSDVGGVAVNIGSAEELRAAYAAMTARVREAKPDAAIRGVYIEEMVRRRYEVLLGAKHDPIFGPAIVFGTGGTAVEVYRDIAIGLPPLTPKLARHMMEETKVMTLLSGYRGVPPCQIETIQSLLVSLARLVTEFPQISELDINPLVVDENGETVLDAKIVLGKTNLL